MASRQEVFEVADWLRGLGVRVSHRSVILELRYGGSNRVVGPLLRDWKVERKYLPKVEEEGRAEVPAEGGGGGSAGDLAEVSEGLHRGALGRGSGGRGGGTGRGAETLEARSRAGDEILDEALARLDVAEAEMGRLRERLTHIEELGPRLPA